MNEFDFLAIFVSIILGLGVTHVLAGAGRAFYRRKQIPIDEVHMVLTGATLLILVLNWWVFFFWQTRTQWTFEVFLILMAWTASFYMLAIFLYPADASDSHNYQEIFDRTRTGYCGSLIASVLLDILQTAIRGDLFHPLWYLPFVGHYAVLATVTMGLRNRRFDRFFAWYLLITLLAWSLIARRYLYAS
jgi:hypothetical protein